MATRKTHLNFVHNDEIWKDHVRHELHSLRQWPKQWGYLTTEYGNLHKELNGEPLVSDSVTRLKTRGAPQPPDSVARLKTRVVSSASLTSKSRPASKSGAHLPGIASSVSSQERPRSAKKDIRALSRATPASRRDLFDLPRLPSIKSESTAKKSCTLEPEPSLLFMGGKAPKPPKFPYTTSGEVGWKSALRANRLEIYGRYAPNARGQHGILNLLEWPSQGL